MPNEADSLTERSERHKEPPLKPLLSQGDCAPAQEEQDQRSHTAGDTDFTTIVKAGQETNK